MSSDPLVLAQIGCGYWGPNLLRNFSSLPHCEMRYVADPCAERRAFVQDNFPKTLAIESADVVFDDPDVATMIVATPAARLFALAKRALEAGKHVLFEKPMATNASEVDELIARCAERGRLVVMAGHTYVIRTESEDALQAHLAEAGIATLLNYPEALPFYPAYAYLGHTLDDFPVAYRNQSRILPLPLYPGMPPEMIRYVIDQIIRFFAER